jgi:hypothetical protein
MLHAIKMVISDRELSAILRLRNTPEVLTGEFRKTEEDLQDQVLRRLTECVIENALDSSTNPS